MSRTTGGRVRPMNRGERGQVVIIVAFAAIALFAIVGLAIDAGRLYIIRAELSRSVDAAALSGILEFNGTAGGLENGVAKAYEYFDANESGADTTRTATPDGNANELTLDATKTVDLLFMSVLGIDTATVSAHAKAGFGTQYLDAVMVLDATPSMAGNPIEEAVDAAGLFKGILLGDSPEGNVSIGVTAFRGCFRPAPLSHGECVKTSGTDKWVQGLSSSHTTLNTVLADIEDASGGGGVGTNVCTGLAMGWNLISDATLNHNNDLLYPDNRQFLILLSDGDNYYPGNNTYQAPFHAGGAYNASSSPTGTTVGGTAYPCQPFDSGASNGSPCTAPWSPPTISDPYPCYTGVFSPMVQIAYDNFNGSGDSCPGNWSSGSGVWSGAWVPSSTPSAPSPQGNTNSAHDTNCHIRLSGHSSGSGAWICRAVDLSNVPGATLRYSLRKSSNWDSGDDVWVQASSSPDACAGGSATWTTIEDVNTGSLSSGGYTDFSESLTTYTGATVFVRFLGSTNASDEYVYVDTIEVQGGSPGDSDGYLNGNDTSTPQNCDSQQKPRERQLDVRTLQLANAMKAQGVEIYVVAFAGGVDNCYLGQPVIYNDEDPAHCGSITDNASYPIGSSGPDGYEDEPDTPNPNVRLLQCIASSQEGSKDHYFYAEDADDLEEIFSTIATQIAHRLIE